MAKQLVGRDNIEQFICHAERKLYVDQTMILSPGGKDYLREKGIALVYGAQPLVAVAPAAAPVTDLSRTIGLILKRDYAITDHAQVAEITRQVLAKLDSQP